MDLLGRICAVIGISLVLTMLLLVLYQDDQSPASSMLRDAPGGVEAQGQPQPAITRAAAAPADGTP